MEHHTTVHERIEQLQRKCDIVACAAISHSIRRGGWTAWDRDYWHRAYTDAQTELRDVRALRDDLWALQHPRGGAA